MSDGSKWGISGEQGPELPVNPRSGKRTMADIEAHADELAQKFMDYEPPTLAEFLLARIAEEDELTAEVSSLDDPGNEGYVGYRLADFEAKRRIVEASMHHAKYDDGALGDYCRGNLALLALPYADHPDYRQEWKP